MGRDMKQPFYLLSNALSIIRLLHTDVQRWLIPQEGCRMSIFRQTRDEGHTLKTKQRRVGRKHLERHRKESRTADNTSHRGTRSQGWTNLLKHLLDGKARKTQQHKVGWSHHLLRRRGYLLQNTLKHLTLGSRNTQLMLPTFRLTSQKTYLTIPLGSKKTRHYVTQITTSTNTNLHSLHLSFIISHLA